MKSFMTALIVLLVATITPSYAADAGANDVYEFKNPALTERFVDLTHLLRCPKCQDQSISDSDAELAGDMRRKTAELLRDDYSDEQVVAYFVERYGDFVSFKPPVRWNTALLWLAPIVVLLLGGLLVLTLLLRARRRFEQSDENETEEPQC